MSLSGVPPILFFVCTGRHPIRTDEFFYLFKSPIYQFIMRALRDGRPQQHLGKGSYTPMACVVSMPPRPPTVASRLGMEKFLQ